MLGCDSVVECFFACTGPWVPRPALKEERKKKNRKVLLTLSPTLEVVTTLGHGGPSPEGNLASWDAAEAGGKNL
jgi:hypothetical protein